MKKLEVILRKEKLDSAVSVIREIGVGGITVWDIKGQGAAEPPLVGDYFTRCMILVVVEDKKVDSILKSIANVACTETKGDGKVFVSNIDEVMDICSKECGHKVL